MKTKTPPRRKAKATRQSPKAKKKPLRQPPQRFQAIGRRRLYEILCNSRGGQWITITAVTHPDMIRPLNRLYWKVAVVKCRIKCNYQRVVNARRRKEGKRANFVAGPLPWGEWDINFPGSPFILLGKNLYLRVHVVRVVENHYCRSTGQPVPLAVIRPLLRKRNKAGRRQKLKHPVQLRTYLFDHIRRISVGRDRYRRTGRYVVSLP